MYNCHISSNNISNTFINISFMLYLHFCIFPSPTSFWFCIFFCKLYFSVFFVYICIFPTESVDLQELLATHDLSVSSQPSIALFLSTLNIASLCLLLSTLLRRCFSCGHLCICSCMYNLELKSAKC